MTLLNYLLFAVGTTFVTVSLFAIILTIVACTRYRQ